MQNLITGGAGFIGFHMTKKLLESKTANEIIIIDNLNNYYDLSFKYERLELLGFNCTEILNSKNSRKKHKSSINKNLLFYQIDLANKNDIEWLFHQFEFTTIINLAAQAGVRYSIENPYEYIDSNIIGFLNILEAAKGVKTLKHLLYASTSSVYGLSQQMPFTEDNCTDHPLAVYAVTKKTNELLAHTYSNLFEIPTTGLRFFTVYGPNGRPDMALYLFAEGIYKEKPIKVFNNGNMIRDFTFVGDIVESIYRLIGIPPVKNTPKFDTSVPKTSISSAPYRILNIGNSKPTNLEDYIKEIEIQLGKKAIRKNYPMQPGDVSATHADTTKLNELIGFTPNTTIQEGIKEFANWYLKRNEV